jgi:hypothetical protein
MGKDDESVKFSCFTLFQTEVTTKSIKFSRPNYILIGHEDQTKWFCTYIGLQLLSQFGTPLVFLQ